MDVLDLHATETVCYWEIAYDHVGLGVYCGGHGPFGGGGPGAVHRGHGSCGPGPEPVTS